jgi:hypothetical protein
MSTFCITSKQIPRILVEMVVLSLAVHQQLSFDSLPRRQSRVKLQTAKIESATYHAIIFKLAREDK